MCDFPDDQHRCAMGGCHNGTYHTFCDEHARALAGYVELAVTADDEDVAMKAARIARRRDGLMRREEWRA